MSEPKFLTASEVAQRWRVSEMTLAKWRSVGEGPSYSKLGNVVRYRLEDIEAFEAPFSKEAS